MSNTNIVVDIQSSIQVAASAQAIFGTVSDHVGTPTWVDKVKKVILQEEGTPPNGLGAVREVHFKPLLWTNVREEIVRFEENEGYSYKIRSGMPGLADHEGTWEIKALPDGKHEVSWKVHFEFRKGHWFRWFLGSFARQFKAVQEEALQSLKNTLE